MSKAKTQSKGMSLALAACDDSVAELAKRLDISVQAVYRWREVPLRRVIEVERATGVAREHLRPDLFGRQLNTGRKSRAAVAA